MNKEDVIICKVIIYLLANNKTEYKYTYNKLKYLTILYIRKYAKLFSREIEVENESFKLLLYKLKNGNMIDISDEVMMNRFVTTNVRFKDENYSLDELALLNIIIDEYSDKPIMTLHSLVYEGR